MDHRDFNPYSEPVQGPSTINWGPLLLLGLGGLALWNARRVNGPPSTTDTTSQPDNFSPMGSGDSDDTRERLLKWGVRGAVAAPLIWKGLVKLDEALSRYAPQAPVQPPTRVEPIQAAPPQPATPKPRTLQEAIESLAAPAEAPSTPTWTPPPDAQWLGLVRHPSVVLIIGKRGGGKSALGYRLLELLRGHGEPYAVGLPPNAAKLLPDWVGVMDRLEDVPTGAVVLLDESYLSHHARGSMTEAGRAIGGLINLSRQKRQTLIFIVQEARQLDVNIVSQIDVLAVKELSELSRGYERAQLRQLTDKARAMFQGLSGKRTPWTWVYSEPGDHEGLVKNELASFWKPRLSHAFADGGQGTGTATSRRGKRPSIEEQGRRARKMRQAGLSYAEIARNLGVSKQTAYRRVKRRDVGATQSSL